VVVGGSLGGMMTALALSGVGCSVDVFECVPQRLEGQGAGLRIVPELARLLQDRAGINLADASTFVSRFRRLDGQNRVISDEEIQGQFTSWGALHRPLAAAFDAMRYHSGEACVGISNRADGVDVRFASGRIEHADLVVFADGILSTGRRLLAPEVELSYAGYVTWRGYVRESDTTEETRQIFADAVTYCVIPYSHIAVYPIPDPTSREPNTRFFNFVWYRRVESGAAFDEMMTDQTGFLRPISLSAGAVQERYITEVKAEARELLAPAHAEIVNRTQEPFLQAIYDLKVPRMVFGRACLVGDAAFVARPHAGAATAKAGVNAWRLADCLDQKAGDVDAALAAWEDEELRLGAAFVDRNRVMGNRSLHENRFNPLDPEHLPGLFKPGEAVRRQG
jgi:2,6-dihydroxypyridine 3-monooxygenase